MSFLDFTKELFGKKEKKIEELQQPNIKNRITDPVFNEKKKEYVAAIEDGKQLEYELNKTISKIEIAKANFYHVCKHEDIKLSKKFIDDPMFNGYIGKCKQCNAEFLDRNKSIAYLNTLSNLLYKFPKVLETLKLINSERDDVEIIIMLKNFLEKIDDLNNEINNIDNNRLMSIIKKRSINNNKGEEKNVY